MLRPMRQVVSGATVFNQLAFQEIAPARYSSKSLVSTPGFRLLARMQPEPGSGFRQSSLPNSSTILMS